MANAISGVISSFGGYGLNNPTVVAFTGCTLCTPASANPKPYTLTMTFAYSPGLSFAGLSRLFYAAFNASAFQVCAADPGHRHSDCLADCVAAAGSMASCAMNPPAAASRAAGLTCWAHCHTCMGQPCAPLPHVQAAEDRALQGNLNNLDSSLTLVAITQILDYDDPSTCEPL